MKKKLLSLVFALLLVFQLSTPGLAANTINTNGKPETLDLPLNNTPNRVVVNFNGDSKSQRGFNWYTTDKFDDAKVIVSKSQDLSNPVEFAATAEEVSSMYYERDKEGRFLYKLLKNQGQVSGYFTDKELLNLDEEYHNYVNVANVAQALGGDAYDTPDRNFVTEHSYKALATGLDAGTKYFYKVGSETGGYSEVGSFETAGNAGDAFTFLHYTDTQNLWQNEKLVDEAWYGADTLKRAFEVAPDAKFVVHTGDVVEQATVEDEWVDILEKSKESLLNTTFAAVAGNHDEYGSTKTVWDTKNLKYKKSYDEGNTVVYNQHFNVPAANGAIDGGSYYSYDFNGVHFVVLNTNDYKREDGKALGEEQLNWVKKDVEEARANGAKWVVLAYHKPLFSKSYHSLQDSDVAKVKDEFMKLIDDLDVDLALQGHDHVISRTKSLKYATKEESPFNAKIADEGTKENGIDVYTNPQGTTFVLPNTGGTKAYDDIYNKGIDHIRKVRPKVGRFLDSEAEKRNTTAQALVDEYENLFAFGEQPSKDPIFEKSHGNYRDSDIQNFAKYSVEDNKITVDLYQIQGKKSSERTTKKVDSFTIVKTEEKNKVENTGEKTLNIVHYNDTHGRYSYTTDKKGVGTNIGYAKVKTIIDEIKTQGPTLVLDAGDTIHGTNFATLSQGESIVKLMEEVGLDAFVPGNHDFNYGANRLLELVTGKSFDVLSTNVLKEDGSKLFTDHKLYEKDGVKVGVFGISTPETVYKSHPDNTKGLDFDRVVEESQKSIEALKAKGAEVIVALSHLGTDLSSEVNTFNTLDKLSNSGDIDVVIDGHSHTVYENGNPYKDSFIASTGQYFENLGVTTIKVKEDGLKEVSSRLIKASEVSEVAENQRILDLIKEIEASNDEVLSEVIGNTKTELNGVRGNVRTGETNLSNLITDSMRLATGADASITNGGGIRASIDSGEITMNEALTVLPFGNLVTVIKVTGQDIVDALNHGTSDYPNAKGAFPQVSGIEYTISHKIVDGKPVNNVVDVKVAGKAVELDKEYKLATNDFMAVGGDGYKMFEGAEQLALHGSILDIFADYIKELSKDGAFEAKTDGRISVKDADEIIPEAPVLNGWHKIQGKERFYVNGTPLAGLRQLGNTRYLFDSNGNKQYGWHKVDGKAYYFSLENGGLLTGLRTIGSTTYLLTKEGKATGWHLLNGKALYFSPENGGLLTGLRTIGSTTYLLTKEGKATGWHSLNNKSYYFSLENGGLLTGLVKPSKTTYLLTKEGKATGWHLLNGKAHFFSPKTGALEKIK